MSKQMQKMKFIINSISYVDWCDIISSHIINTDDLNLLMKIAEKNCFLVESDVDADGSAMVSVHHMSLKKNAIGQCTDGYSYPEALRNALYQALGGK